jgi:hypothetical protein
MKKELLVIASAVLMLSSCSKTENSLPLSTDQLSTSTSNTTPAKENTYRKASPFQGSINYSFNASYDLPCDCGPYYPVGTFSGSGNLSHLGKSTSNIKPCVSPIFVSGAHTGDHVGVECASFVSANGDELYCHTFPYDLIYTPTAAIGNVYVEFTGGTGRFSNATGNFTGIVTVPYGTGTATLTDINGTINY